ncbi:MAG TPA: amidohydrolase family protein [Stellaceae bacterium]|jgi:predicted TIM-barrel fold metal-dependent hydrolase|nr:amidohydrolase family protein [Stellaceae bacterium]
MAQPFRIDVHHHPTPCAEISNGKRAVPPNMKDWTAAMSLEDMDKNGVQTSILSLNHPIVVWPSDQAQAIKQAREWNEFMTKQGRDHPGRFGVFAVLPILNIEASLRELEYALDTLKADGINMMTNIGDKWLGDPYYFPLFEELNRRKAVIYTHPMAPTCTANMMMPEVNDSMIEFATDTSRAIARMLFNGAAHRFRDIKFIFSHAGGTMPYILERYTRHPLSDKKIADMVPEGVVSYLKRFYYDTAQASHPFAMSSITKLVAISQLLFGTDFPYRNAEDHVKGLRECGFSDSDLKAIERDNALRLLPKWGK